MIIDNIRNVTEEEQRLLELGYGGDLEYDRNETFIDQFERQAIRLMTDSAEVDSGRRRPARRDAGVR